MRTWQWAVTIVIVAGMAAAPAIGQTADSVYVPDIETFMQIGGNYSPQVSRDGKVRCFSSSMLSSATSKPSATGPFIFNQFTCSAGVGLPTCPSNAATGAPRVGRPP